MESIRRKIKIFWLEHRDPILFYSIVIAGIIVVVQLLNQTAILNSEEDTKNNNIENEQYYDYSTSQEDKELIEDFITYCKENNMEKAYSLISNKCKSDLYPTIKEFEEKYYNNRFYRKRTVQIDYQREKNIYVISFYPDLLESGKYIDSESIVDYFKIEQELLDRKININYK